MKITIMGSGKMGKSIQEVATPMQMSVSEIFDIDHPIKTTSTVTGDVIIDFTNQEAFLSNLDTLLSFHKPIVVGTTGWSHELESVKKKVIANNGTMLYSSNFSLGVQMFLRLVREAGKLIAPFHDFDIAVEEQHHNQKLDYPSGTAVSAASAILETVPRKEKMLNHLEQGVAIKSSDLQVSSVRIGSVFGKHSVYIDSLYDEITISHSAKNRLAFSKGALEVAKWIKDKKGFFTIQDFMNEILKK